MGDVSTGIGFLCCSCCGIRHLSSSVDLSTDGSRFGSRGVKADPRERQIDKMFMQREYRQDSSGRFTIHSAGSNCNLRQPTPTPSMLMAPRQKSDESKISRVSKESTRAEAEAEGILNKAGWVAGPAHTRQVQTYDSKTTEVTEAGVIDAPTIQTPEPDSSLLEPGPSTVQRGLLVGNPELVHGVLPPVATHTPSLSTSGTSDAPLGDTGTAD